MSESYDQAALRHFSDAEYLAARKSFDGAGHLIGFAAEYALKHAITSLRPDLDAPQKHFPDLRHLARKHLNARTHGGLHRLLSAADYLDGWSVDGRYAADGAVTEDTYRRWREQASRSLGAAGLRRPS